MRWTITYWVSLRRICNYGVMELAGEGFVINEATSSNFQLGLYFKDTFGIEAHILNKTTMSCKKPCTPTII